MKKKEREILSLIQKDFPLVERPFEEISKKLDLAEHETIEIIKGLLEKGIIRRIGANIDSKRLGYATTLCGCKVPAERIEEFVKVVNSYRGVTHNYERDHSYNIWFTLIAPSRADINEIIAEIKEKSGIEEIENLPVKRSFKLNLNLDLE